MPMSTAFPKRMLGQCRRIAQRAGRVWRELGALEYRERAGDDLKTRMGRPFTRTANARPGETGILSWIVYRSRAHRDRVNARVMKDPRMQRMMKEPMPFELKRMSYGGFPVLVDA